MGKFDGKRLLFLGGHYPSQDMLKYVKREGGYIVATDNCDIDKYTYKDIVDKVINIPTNDIEALTTFAKENNIDGVGCGGHESVIECAREVNERIGNTYYHTKEQWDNFANKMNFRALCNKYGIKTPKTYFMGAYKDLTRDIIDNINYPVIVKPTDKMGGLGISVCTKSGQLKRAIIKAKELSDSSQIIIEEWISGLEFSVTYVMQNGIVKAVSTYDKYAHKERDLMTVLPDTFIFPSKYHDYFMNNVDKNIIKMIESEGLKNGTIFFQGIVKDGEIYIFEAGLRIEGSGVSKTTLHYSKQDFVKFLVDYLLKVKTDYDINKEDSFFNGRKTVMFCLHVRDGVIGKIENFFDCIKDDLVYREDLIVSVGTKATSKHILTRALGSVRMDTDDLQIAVEKIKEFKKHIKVYDRFGFNMLERDFNPEKILQ